MPWFQRIEEYCVWKGQATKEEQCKESSTFLAQTIHLRDDEPGDELGSWLFQFVSVSFFSSFFSVFGSFKVNFTWTF